MKKLILAGLVALGTWGVIAAAPAPAVAAGACDNVRCAACPEGTYWAPIPKDCCRCLPVE